MRNTGSCPKCACRRLYVVDEVTLPDVESANRQVPVCLMAAPIGQDVTGIPSGTRYRSDACKVEAWVCSACGLVEWYAKALGELEILSRHRDGGVRIVDSPGSIGYR